MALRRCSTLDLLIYAGSQLPMIVAGYEGYLRYPSTSSIKLSVSMTGNALAILIMTAKTEIMIAVIVFIVVPAET